MADAPATTWLLVIAKPEGSMMNPDPVNPPSIGLSSEGNWKEPDTSMRITAFCASAIEATSPSGGGWAVVDVVVVDVVVVGGDTAVVGGGVPAGWAVSVLSPSSDPPPKRRNAVTAAAMNAAVIPAVTGRLDPPVVVARGRGLGTGRGSSKKSAGSRQFCSTTLAAASDAPTTP